MSKYFSRLKDFLLLFGRHASFFEGSASMTTVFSYLASAGFWISIGLKPIDYSSFWNSFWFMYTAPSPFPLILFIDDLERESEKRVLWGCSHGYLIVLSVLTSSDRFLRNCLIFRLTNFIHVYFFQSWTKEPSSCPSRGRVVPWSWVWVDSLRRRRDPPLPLFLQRSYKEYSEL